MKKHGIAASASVLVLALAGCGTSDSNTASEPETVTMTTESDQPPTSETSAEPASPPESTPPAPATQPASQVGGDCGTGDDGTSIKALELTSCEFAREIYNVAGSVQYVRVQKDPTATALLHADGLQIASPVTGETYTIDCYIGSSGQEMMCQQQGDKTVGGIFSKPWGQFWDLG